MDDIDKILELQRNRKLDLSLNDYIFAFLRITELTDQPFFNKVYGLSEVLDNIKAQLKKEEEDEPIIGRLCLAFKRAEFFNNIDIWIDLCDRMQADRFDRDSEEIYAAIQGIFHLQRKVHEEWQLEVVQNVFTKLYKYSIFHLKQNKFNLRSLTVLTKYMIKNRILDHDLYREIEHSLQHILTNFGKNLDKHLLENQAEPILLPNFERRTQQAPLLLIEFGQMAYYFSEVEYYSEMYFHFLSAWILEGLKYSQKFQELKQQRIQDIIEQKQRWQELQQELNELQENKKNQNYSKMSKEQLEVELDRLLNQKTLQEEEEELHELVWPLEIDGKTTSNLLQFFNFCHVKNAKNVMDNRIKNWLFRMLKRQEFEYTIENLYNIHKEENHEINLEHIKLYIEIRAVQEYEGDFQKINQRVYQFLDDMCLYNMDKFDSYSILLFTYMLEQEDIQNEFPKFIKALPKFVNDNIKYYDFEEVCYFCLMLHRWQPYIEGDTSQFWSQVTLMLDHIKISTYSRGFKIDMASHFTQLLQEINMAEFFGEQY
ncbi:hypothetical protein PPERSA_05555 [Pseudocohnilembus persalinus]|uniref:Uncharacterized protein n=1 Tax=Pseudocohnilembus persalinus TaxID=266149 RepID=A0A0V0QT88_PSEPJ|nr:hypothetical protein PPERSA_05555 [Pseudocohnilembus persalinus]|eukprot:KRX05446.1 hypothetical protein PPERSA_05555 [Pseudocohnilembus persalinus]